MVEDLNELCEQLERGAALHEVATVRPSPIKRTPPDLLPAEIRAIRESLGLSTSLFAGFLGLRASTLRSWEHGETRPSPLARRFLEEIRDDREYWIVRLKKRDALSATNLKKAT
jgi:putative transcriptional regulator